jgi:hypothetical protein
MLSDICPSCGQRHDNTKICIMSKEASLIILGFLSSQLITLSRFNKFFNVFPSKELYDNFCLFVNLPNSKEIEDLYGEDYFDILLLSVGNLENNQLFSSFFFPQEEKEDVYRNDLDFSPSLREERKKISSYLENKRLKIEDIKENNGKILYSVLGRV